MIIPSFLIINNVKEFIPVILAFIIIIILLKYKYIHRFWDNQPVMRKVGNNDGIIGIRPTFNIKLTNPNHKILINKVSVDKIIPFLKDNFSDNYNIDDNYLTHIYNKPNSINACMMNNDEIIGFIHSSPIDILCNNKHINFQYADFLCVKKSYRSISIASVIIAAFLNNMKSNKQPVLFKKEHSTLPFIPILDTYYYVKDLTKLKPIKNTNVTELTVYNFYKLYSYVNNLLKRYKFYKLYTKQEFFEIFLEKKILKLFIIDNTNNMKSIIIGKKNIYNVFNKIYNCFEIDYIIGELRYPKDVYNSIANHLKNDGYNFISIPKMGSNPIFIEENNFIKGSKLYYYTYNYNISPLKLNDFCFNIN